VNLPTLPTLACAGAINRQWGVANHQPMPRTKLSFQRLALAALYVGHGDLDSNKYIALVGPLAFDSPGSKITLKSLVTNRVRGDASAQTLGTWLAAVDEMDLWDFYAAYRVDGRSRPAYEPAMMVALLLYAYARGIRSSRLIERACEEDVAFRVLAAQQRPDHATIARFVVRHERSLGELFGEVLVLCADAGLATVGVIAIDGTKVAANVKFCPKCGAKIQ